MRRMQINLVGWQRLNRVWFWGKEGSKGRDRRRANGGDRRGGEKRACEEEEEGEGGVGCSHRQAHSSCNACWDVLGSVPHSTITACSGVLCWAPLCSDHVLLSFVTFSLLELALVFPFVFPCLRRSVCLCSVADFSSLSLSLSFFFSSSSVSLFLNLLPKLSLNDLLQLFEQNISISCVFLCFFEP